MEENQLQSCLRNERVIVRFVPRETRITNPKHILYGGMSEGAVRYYTVPIMQSTGAYKNVLTDSEKEFLENYMGLDYNALSVYKKEDNYWANFKVRLTKQDTILDLSNPNDYIKYKVLRANSDFIADSLDTLQNYPKSTYQFVLIKEGDSEKQESVKMSTIMKCYKEYGKIEDDKDTLRTILSMLDGRTVARNTKLEFLQGKINTHIQANPKLFYSIISDPTLPVKVLIKRAVEGGLIYKKGNYYYLKEDNSPLCGPNQEPTLSTAAKYLLLPKNQELRFTIEAKLKIED